MAGVQPLAVILKKKGVQVVLTRYLFVPLENDEPAVSPLEEESQFDDDRGAEEKQTILADFKNCDTSILNIQTPRTMTFNSDQSRCVFWRKRQLLAKTNLFRGRMPGNLSSPTNQSR
jgi:hypothetical protein